MNLLGMNNSIKTALFGGTFDPVHNGHIKILELFLKEFDYDKVFLVPAGNPYMKPIPPIASGLQRYEMCKIAFRDYNKIEVINFEIERKSPSYTIDTLKFLAESRKEYKIESIIVGLDAFNQLDMWKDGHKLKKNFHFFIIDRDSSEKEGYPQNNLTYIPKISQISSSKVRKKILSKQPILNDTPIEIASYIEDNNLYRNG